ncbi:MBL fold metallo-hydrolase [Patulibacter brassicae]|uniref:MBL fold metallo-hydrolase n=1 Tax=Patulibacter brassicae TaxID=1705717 RepID=A0ABU4VKC4_9ACTN|nr:MBL fold metallo-hydrolase [Patulibacter brassicae]MDX8151534.1 MBL fold metallo-hydrolase [Patulibacter brassicae]
MDQPLTVEELAPGITRIALPVPGIDDGVNVHLLRGGGPTTLVDAAMPVVPHEAALAAGLAAAGAAVADVEQVLLTHHHVDHVGLAGWLVEAAGATVRTGARVAEVLADPRTAYERELDWGERHAGRHDAPPEVLASTRGALAVLDGFRPVADVVPLAEGDVVPAGDLELEVLERPGHSPTDVLLRDGAAAVAAVGDHLFATAPLTPVLGSMVAPGARPAVAYLAALAETAARGDRLVLTGHGPALRDAGATIAARRERLDRRTARIAALLGPEPRSGWAIARELWPSGPASAYGLTRLASVLASLELLEDAGTARRVDAGDRVLWAAAGPRPTGE